MKHKRTNGFTLVELLVVIAIISILAALLLPALETAMESARRAQCASQQKQMHLSATTYYDAFDGYFAIAPIWRIGDISAAANVCSDQDNINPKANMNGWWIYLRHTTYMDANLINCPSMDYTVSTTAPYGRLHYDYRYNTAAVDTLNGAATYKRNCLDDARYAQTALFKEATGFRLHANASYPVVENTGDDIPLTYVNGYRWSHIIGGNMVQHDGAVRFVLTDVTQRWPHYYSGGGFQYTDVLLTK